MLDRLVHFQGWISSSLGPSAQVDRRLGKGLRRSALCLILIFSSATVIALNTQAATVKNSKATKALLNLDKGESLEVGDTLIIGGENGDDPKAVLEVTVVRKKQVMADIKSGEASKGDRALKPKEQVEVEKPAPAVKEPSAPAPTPSVALPELPTYRFVGLGGGIDNQRVKLTQTAEVAMKGMSPFLRGSLTGPHFYGHQKMEWEAGASLEQIRTLGNIASTACRGSRDCAFEISAVSPFARVGYLFLGRKALEPALRGGVDVVVPLIVNSNVIEYAAFNPLLFMTVGAQLKIRLGPRTRLPISIDYAYYFGNSDVTLSRLMLWGGYSWH